MTRRWTIKAVLFDLDGTLADTAPEMSAAVNALRVERGFEPLEADRLRPWVSHGSPGLLKIAFGVEREAADYAGLRERFLHLYESRLGAETKLFPGMQDVLNAIESAGLAWGIVTNKPAWLTDPLLADMDLRPAPGCVVSGDTTAHHKPHPAPILLGCERLDKAPSECIYIGDAERDVQAAHAAGMPALAAAYGYLAEDEDPATWKPDGIIHSPGGLLDWLDSNTARGPHNDD